MCLLFIKKLCSSVKNTEKMLCINKVFFGLSRNVVSSRRMLCDSAFGLSLTMVFGSVTFLNFYPSKVTQYFLNMS